MKNLTQKISIVALLLMASVTINAQNVGINENGAAPSNDALLDINSNVGANKGLLIPRVNIANLATAAPVTAPTTSLLVYNTNATTGLGYYYWNGAAWVKFTTGGDDWKIIGNGNTTSGTHFLGTTNGQALDFRTNNTLRFRVANANQVHAMSAGTAALPFYSFGSDANTGMSNLSADQLNWSTGGTERLRLSNTQLATTFSGTAAVPAYSFTTDTDLGMFRATTNELAFSTAGTERVRIDNVGNVGIKNNNPTQSLDVTGNVRFSGALMPNNQSGLSSQTLLSNGAGNAPTWSTFTFLNTPAISNIGKFYSGLFNLANNTALTLTVADANCIASSTCTYTWRGPLPVGPLYALDLLVTVEAQNGQWVFHIINKTGWSFTNLQFSYFAAY